MRKFFFFIFLALFINSCSVHTFTIGDGPKDNYEKTIKQHNFIGGLISDRTTEISELKNERNYELTVKRTISDTFFSLLSFGLYTPTTIIIIK